MTTSANYFAHSFPLGCVRNFFLQLCLILIGLQGAKNFVIENGIIKGVEEDVFIWEKGYGDWILEKLKATPDFVGQVNCTLMLPNMLVKLCKSPAVRKYDILSLKFSIVGDTMLKKETQISVMKRFPDLVIYHAYGSTEVGAVVLRGGPDSKPGSCGTVLPNVSTKVIDTETGKILGPNQTGEAWIRSPNLMNYYCNPKDTRATIDSEGWMHSADLIYFDEEGNFFVTDRIKEMIKYKDHHVSPAMIEQILSSHPGVSEVAVVSKPHEDDDEHPVAFVVKTLHYPHNVTAEDLKKMVAESLPDQMKLRGGVIFMNQLPHTSSGKIAKPQLKKIARKNNNTVIY